jgi:hypothetical protein
VHQAIALIAMIIRVFGKLAMENATHAVLKSAECGTLFKGPGPRADR